MDRRALGHDTTEGSEVDHCPVGVIQQTRVLESETGLLDHFRHQEIGSFAARPAEI